MMQSGNSRSARNTMRALLLFVVLVVTMISPALATTINVGMLAEPIDVSTTPTITLISHGPLNKTTYRLTMEVVNRETSCTMTLNPNDQKSALWITYDDDPTTYGVQRISFIANSGANDNHVNFTRNLVPAIFVALPTPPGITNVADYDFPLPAGRIPERFTLKGPNVDMGCGPVARIDTTMPLNGRNALQALAESDASPPPSPPP